MTKVRDTQKSKVYNWGYTYGGRERRGDLTLDQCEQLVKDAYAHYGLVWSGRIKDGRGTTWARGGTTVINLPLWARAKVIVLHEAAHGIHQRLSAGLEEQAAHGPEFARVLLELIAHFKVAKAPEARARARELGVKVSQSKRYVPPPATLVKRAEAARLAVAEARRALTQAETAYNLLRSELRLARAS